MKLLNLFLVCVVINFKIFFLNAYDMEAMAKVSNFEIDLIYENLCYAPLNNMFLCGRLFYGARLIGADLRNSHIRKSGFCGADMHKAILIKSDLEKSDLRNVNLREANITNADVTSANFENAKMHGVKLDGAKVAGANFKGVKGLTNEQKKYLREHGAINVPTDIVYEQDDSQVGHEVAPTKSMKERLFGFILRRYKHYFQTKNASVQTNAVG